MQRTGTEAIRTQIQPSKPKGEFTNITNSQNTKRTYGQLSLIKLAGNMNGLEIYVSLIFGQIGQFILELAALEH